MKMESEVRIPPPVKEEPAIKEVINKVKSQGLFDQFRKECIADVDTKPAYHNLIQRVESYVEHFLQGQKWTLGANKNQLRETLRRQLHNSGMMQNGVERIIEQVVNPKILLGIKPKIDEAVSSHLGIDLKARQEEQQRRKQEQQKLLIQQLQQQQHLQSIQNQNVKNDEAFKSSGTTPPAGSNPWMSGMANFPSPSVPGVHSQIPGGPGNPQAMGGNFPGMMSPFSMMGGWMPGFNTGMPPMMPGQPMIPAFPSAPGVSPVAGIGPRTPFNSSASVTPATCASMVTSPQTKLSVTASTPIIPDLTKPPPGLPGTPSSASNVSSMIVPSPGISPLVPPGTSRVAPAPMGSIPPPPGTVPIAHPDASSRSNNRINNLSMKSNNIPSTPTIPALISHTLAKVSQDELTPEKIAVFKTAAAFITKTVNNAQGTPGADLNSIFSPRVLAEAMMEESGKLLTKQEIRAQKRKERMKEMERQRAEKEEREMTLNQGKMMAEEDKENPLPPKHNLMDAFQGAEDVSDDEEALDLLMDMEEPEDRNKQGIVLSDDSDKEGEKPPTSQRGKRYNFAWDVDLNSDNMSDVTISSIHTSDMSSFEEEEEEDEDEQSAYESTKEEESKETLQVEKSEDLSTKEEELLVTGEVQENLNDSEEPAKSATEVEQSEEQVTPAGDVQPVEVESAAIVGMEEEVAVPEKLSELAPEAGATEPPQNDLVSKASEPAPAKPRKLKALSYHYSDSDDDETREERKARIAKEKEERYLKRQQRRAELDAKKKERDEEKARLKKEKQLLKESTSDSTEDKALSATETSQTDIQNATSTSIDADSPSKATPKKRKNKAEMKEQMLQQKVMEKKAALRRKRTRNRRYASDEFTSIFSDRKKLNQSYTADGVTQEEIVTFEGDGALEIVEMTIDQECVVETVGEEIETSNLESFGHQSSEVDRGPSSDLVLQCPSPYSDISDRSMSERSEPENVSDPGVDEVSSDDELGDLEEVNIVEELEDSSKGPSSPFQSASESDVGQVSEAVTPDASRMSSTRSKSILSQDEVESISNQSMEKRKTSDTGLPRDEGDLESYQNGRLESSIKSPVKSISDIGDGDSFNATKGEDETTAASISPSKDIMADLELEPVSDEDSSLDGCLDQPETADENRIDNDKEEGEDRDSDREARKFALLTRNDEARKSFEKVKTADPEEENASDEGEIKSDSEEEVKKEEEDTVEMEEEKRRRAANRKPIHQVDFGEAEKRARETRVLYSGEQDWRNRNLGMNPMTPSYRGGFNTWSGPGTSSMPQYGPPKPGNRYVSHDPSSPIRPKSPTGAFDPESETSSHSRSSVRVRDDVPPPYPIEGVNTSRKHRSPASISDNAVDYKPLSSPSPVSSSSSRISRTRSRSRSRSLSSRSSRSSSYSSGSRASSSRKRKRSKKSKRKRKRKEKQRIKEIPSSPLHSPPSRPSSSIERRISPRKSPDLPSPSASNSARDIHLSSGNESISSDELPYFPDDEVEVPVKAAKQKIKRSGSSSSSGSSSFTRSKHLRKASTGSISSSELIYSPTRTKVVSENKDQQDSSSSSSDKEKKPKRRRSSSMKSSSSDLPPVSPVRESAFSPHRPSSPITYPPLPDDMSGFQPPLPQEPEPIDLPPLPPMPPRDFPPSPPSPPPQHPQGNPAFSEEEEGEYSSSPEQSHPYQSQSQEKKNEEKDQAAVPSFSPKHQSGESSKAEIANSVLVNDNESESNANNNVKPEAEIPALPSSALLSSLPPDSDTLKNSTAVCPNTLWLESEETSLSGCQKETIEPSTTLDSHMTKSVDVKEAEAVKNGDLKDGGIRSTASSILNERESEQKADMTSSPSQIDTISNMSSEPKEVTTSETSAAPISDLSSPANTLSEEQCTDKACDETESQNKVATELVVASSDNNNKSKNSDVTFSTSEDVSSEVSESIHDTNEHARDEHQSSKEMDSITDVTCSSSGQKSVGLESNIESRKRLRDDDENSCGQNHEESDPKRIKESDDD